jgi:UDP-N-acetylglucosamine 2-epimerase (non-hydrolysing)
MSKLKIMTVFGTRPEAIKMAPVVKELNNNDQIDCIVTVTAQHREMLDQVLELFKISTNYDLDIMKDRQTLGGVTRRVLSGLENVLIKEEPDLILVHGDTTTTFVASLAAFYQQIKVGHVEAGLRTYNKYSPFPEEINRQLTGRLADLNFAPTSLAKENLLTENIDEQKIFVTGNTVIDALLDTVKEEYHFNNQILNNIDFNKKKIILLTAHRRENLGQNMESIFSAVNEVLKESKDAEVIFPVHLNPAVREIAAKHFSENKRVHLIEPLDYEPFANLMNLSHLVLTDSGGIQEEAPSLGKPVLVLRDTTERPEAIKMGTVKKVGTDYNQIKEQTLKLLNDDNYYNQMSNAVNPYGDGKASKRILSKILFDYDLIADAGEEFKL